MASLIKRNGKWLSKPVQNPATGKRTTKQFDTQEEALAYEVACAEALSSDAPHLPEVTAVALENNLQSLAASTLTNRYSHRTEATRRTMRDIMRPIVSHFGPNTPVSQVLVRDTMTAYVNGKADRAASTRNQYRIVINALVKEAADRGLVREFSLRLEKVDNASDRFLSKDEEDRLMAALAPEYRSLVRFTILTGLRLDAALSVTPEMIQGNALRVRLKGMKRGSIPLTDEARDLLLNRDWADIERKTLQKHFKSAALRCGWKDVSFHTLRHTTASRLVQKGASLVQVMHLLGHNNYSTTQRYAHLSPDYGDALLGLID